MIQGPYTTHTLSSWHQERLQQHVNKTESQQFERKKQNQQQFLINRAVTEIRHPQSLYCNLTEIVCQNHWHQKLSQWNLKKKSKIINNQIKISSVNHKINVHQAKASYT